MDSARPATILRDGMAIVAGRITWPATGASDSELRALGPAVNARLAEFSAGRALARAAGEAVGMQLRDIAIGEEGEPVWPAGVVGSISHSRTLAAAAVAQSSRFRAVGIDLDDTRPLGSAASLVATSAERSLVLANGWAATDDQAARVVFCSKEAVFKCQFSLTFLRDLDFIDVELVANGRGRPAVRLSHELPPPVGAAVAAVELDWVRIAGAELALAAIPRRV